MMIAKENPDEKRGDDIPEADWLFIKQSDKVSRGRGKCGRRRSWQCLLP
jgi:hypothetical protein